MQNEQISAQPGGRSAEPVGFEMPALLAGINRIIRKNTPAAGDYPTAIPGLELFRRDSPVPPKTCIIEPGVVLATQGVKQMWLGGEPFRYDASRFLVASLDLPANSEVLEASREEPCLGFVFRLDLQMMTELIAQGSMPPPSEKAKEKGAGLGTVTPALLSPLCRLLQLLDEPEAAPFLEPMIRREIHYRLLLSDQAEKLYRIASADSREYRVSRAIEWLKVHFSESLRIDDLASRVRMSTPTFHQHFRQLTAMSPLQYQKWLRLSEAKRLMLNEHMDVSSAAYRVGYESPSQFSREYSRLFGTPPKRDITALRSAAPPSIQNVTA